MRHIICLLLLITACYGHKKATDVFLDIYKSCLSQYSVGCVKPKALAWISDVVRSQEIQITDDLVIVKTGQDDPVSFNQEGRSNIYVELLDKLDGFVATHSIRMTAPKVLLSQEARSFIPNEIADLATPLEVPLSEGNAVEGMQF